MKELLKKLIRAESTEHAGELAAAKVIADYFTAYGIDSEIDSWSQNRANITAHIKGSGEKPALLFSCHLDVVPPGEAKWQYPPFEAVEIDGKIFGRGAADMKGSTAALLAAIVRLKESGADFKGDIIFSATAGEETDSCGAKKFVTRYKNKLPPLAGIVIAEPTNFEVITAHRGLLWLEVAATGKTAHGSMPQLGVNAINSMRSFLDELDNIKLSTIEHPKLGTCSMSINTIEAGKAINVVPDLCSVKLDIRTVPGKANSDIIANIEKLFAKLKAANPDFDAKVKVIRDVPAMETNDSSEFVQQFICCVGADKTITAGFCTDGPVFGDLAAPVVIFGPGQGGLCHKPDEYIEIADLEKAVAGFSDILKNFVL